MEPRPTVKFIAVQTPAVFCAVLVILRLCCFMLVACVSGSDSLETYYINTRDPVFLITHSLPCINYLTASTIR